MAKKTFGKTVQKHNLEKLKTEQQESPKTGVISYVNHFIQYTLGDKSCPLNQIEEKGTGLQSR